MKTVFAPGCALMLYKPHLAEKIALFLRDECGCSQTHLLCCRHEPRLCEGTRVVNVCPGCDKRFGSLYEGVSTVSLWEILARSETFAFPDYHGARMSVHDACPTRSQERVHAAVRTLLQKMNIAVDEPEATRQNAVCCGDSFYGKLPDGEVLERMKKRAADMPCKDVAVYCVSCVKSMANGGKNPRYLVDLLFNERTDADECDPTRWHDQLDQYIEAH